MDILTTPATVCQECAGHRFVPEPFGGKDLIPCPKCAESPEPEPCRVDIEAFALRLEALAADIEADPVRYADLKRGINYGRVETYRKVARWLRYEQAGRPAHAVADQLRADVAG